MQFTCLKEEKERNKMNDKSLFRNIAKQVHPDMTNSEFASGSKMREVIQNKNNPHVLLRLAQKWGLNLDGTFNSFAFDKKAEDYARTVYETVVGAIIRHSVLHKRKITMVRGVIVGIREITKGYSKGGREFKIYDFENTHLWTFKTMNREPFDKIVGMSDESIVNEGKEKFEHSKQMKKMVAQHKQNAADNHFDRIGLQSGKRYGNIEVTVGYRGGVRKVETLIRTTAKSAYVYCFGYKNNERRIPIGSVVNIRRK